MGAVANRDRLWRPEFGGLSLSSEVDFGCHCLFILVNKCAPLSQRTDVSIIATKPLGIAIVALILVWMIGSQYPTFLSASVPRFAPIF